MYTPDLLTPSIQFIAGLFLTLGVVWAALVASKMFRTRRSLKQQVRVFEIKDEGGTVHLNKFIKLLDAPFTVEVAVHQLGSDIHTYIVLPANKAKSFAEKTGLRESNDYNIYHPGGANMGVSLGIKETARANSDLFMYLLNDMDFSKVNEIGEGVVFQLVFGERSRDGSYSGNIRLLASAPTPYQVKEILSSLSKELSGCKWTEEKGSDFVERVTYRQFDPRRAMVWTQS